MPEYKYFDHIHDRPIDLESDGCDLEQWRQEPGDCRFAVHSQGFRVFLPYEKLESSDEYADSDPYSVEKNIESGFQKRRIELTLELVRESLDRRGATTRILDIGCGEGHITEKIRLSVENSDVTGVDYSLSAIAYAHQRFPGIDFVVGDACDLPFAKGFFDVVVCNNIWEHVPDPVALLCKIKRCLSPGGYLIISTPSRYRTGNLIRVLRGKPVAFMSEHHVTEYTVGQVKEQLAFGGFEVKRVLTKPIAPRSQKIRLARRVFSTVMSIVGSHHALESTVFYLAKETSSAFRG